MESSLTATSSSICRPALLCDALAKPTACQHRARTPIKLNKEAAMPEDFFCAGLDDLPKESLLGGAVQRFACVMDNALVLVVKNGLFGETLGVHSHPFDQLSFVLGGTMEVIAGEETRQVGPDGVVYFPANIIHSGTVVGPEVPLIIDVFSPVREDYRYLAAGQFGRKDVGPPPQGIKSSV